MNFDDLKQYFDNLPDKVMEVAPDVIADTATEYFKERFTEKAYDGNPWKAGKPKATGSLLVDSGALLNSIRPVYVGQDKVTISAGDLKVDYARIHNEGFQGPVFINPFQRTRRGKIEDVKGHTRNMDIPQRQFMGPSNELAQRIKDRLQPIVKEVAKQLK